MRSVAIATLLVLTACGPGRSEPAPQVVADVAPAGWQMVAPGGDTVCALGTEYRFFTRTADPDRLLVHLQGGGACSSGRNCDPDSEPTYSRDVDETDNPENRPHGIFDLDNPANPVADYTMVMVPYCTGDVHLGDRTTTYPVQPEEGDPYEVTIEHRGYRNVMSALDWTFAHVANPREVVVTGSSAGSIPAPFYGQLVAAHYPGAEVTVVGDAAGSYRRDAAADPAEAVDAWGMIEVVRRAPGYEGLADGEIGFAALYEVAGTQQPDLRLFQFDSAHDAVQAFYSRNAGAADADPLPRLRANRAEIRAAVPRFAGYTAGGTEHTILGRDAFYWYETDGVLFRDWFAAAVGGDEVRDAACADCTRPGLHYTEADRRLIERLQEAISDPDAWSREDPEECPSSPPWSLRCAATAAAVEVGLDGDTPSLLDLRLEAASRARGRGGPLRAFNTAPSTTHGDVLAAVQAVEARVAAHHHD